MVKLKTFQEVIDIANKTKSDNYLLLGNGFSIGCNLNFRYQKLFEKAEFSQEIQDIFQEFDTYDFEKIVNKLNDAVRLLKNIEEGKKLSERLSSEAILIKQGLISAISAFHPGNQSEVASELDNCINFLANFKMIFTLNYDLLLYWALIRDFRDGKNLFDIKDGFRAIWNTEYLSEQNIFYLHGALHLFDNGINTYKLKYNEFDGNLISQIEEKLEQDKFPLIVAEGSSREKLEKIRQNRYLDSCLNEFGNIEGNLFIYGHSLANNDKHILQLISKNKGIRNLFISVYQPDNNYEEIETKANQLIAARKGEPKLKIYYYDAESANIWNNED